MRPPSLEDIAHHIVIVIVFTHIFVENIEFIQTAKRKLKYFVIMTSPVIALNLFTFPRFLPRDKVSQPILQSRFALLGPQFKQICITVLSREIIRDRPKGQINL